MATKELERHLIWVAPFLQCCPNVTYSGLVNNIASFCLRDLFLVIMGEVLNVSKPNSAAEAAAGIGHFLWCFVGSKQREESHFRQCLKKISHISHHSSLA